MQLRQKFFPLNKLLNIFIFKENSKTTPLRSKQTSSHITVSHSRNNLDSILIALASTMLNRPKNSFEMATRGRRVNKSQSKFSSVRKNLAYAPVSAQTTSLLITQITHTNIWPLWPPNSTHDEETRSQDHPTIGCMSFHDQTSG